MSNSYDIKNSDIKFVTGEYVEVYFPEEKIEYGLEITNKIKGKFEKNTIFLSLPKDIVESFYKGEDFVECRYVSGNIVYEFGGEIVKIEKDLEPYVVIKMPSQFKKSNKRKNNRISTKILCEYFVKSANLSYDENIKTRGFATIKDVSLNGVSILTTDNIPIGSILQIDILKKNISLTIEIKKCQIINSKNFYGTKIIDYVDDSEKLYRLMIENLFNNNNLEQI